MGMDHAVGNGVCGDDAVLQDEVNASRELVMSQQGCGRAGKLKSGKSDSSFCLGELLITEVIGWFSLRLFLGVSNFPIDLLHGALWLGAALEGSTQGHMNDGRKAMDGRGG